MLCEDAQVTASLVSAVLVGRRAGLAALTAARDRTEARDLARRGRLDLEPEAGPDGAEPAPTPSSLQDDELERLGLTAREREALAHRRGFARRIDA
jgi:hypothetical protein